MFPLIWLLSQCRFSNHQIKHLLCWSHSTIAASHEGNERTTFSFCWAQDFPMFLKKETASQDKGEVMTVNLLQNKLSLLESAPAVSFEWISSCVAHLDCPPLALAACGDWCGVREPRAARISSIRWLSCGVAQSSIAQRCVWSSTYCEIVAFLLVTCIVLNTSRKRRNLTSQVKLKLQFVENRSYNDTAAIVDIFPFFKGG